jgi:hypothetical protein
MIDQLRGQYQAISTAAGHAQDSTDDTDMTVVFDAGQNSEANFAHLAASGLHYIGSVPASDCPDLTALPPSVRVTVEADRFGGLSAYDTRCSGLRHPAQGDPDPLTRTARRPGRRLRRHHPGQGRQETG